MTPIELRELDTWIHSNVLGADQLVGLKKRGYWYRPDAHGYTDRENEAWHLTREELAICLFAKELFTVSAKEAGL